MNMSPCKTCSDSRWLQVEKANQEDEEGGSLGVDEPCMMRQSLGKHVDDCNKGHCSG